jgi:hypothetical protein
VVSLSSDHFWSCIARRSTCSLEGSSLLVHVT